MGIGLRGRRKRGGGRGRENGEGRRKVTPALYTRLFTLCPLFPGTQIMSTFNNQKLARAFTHG